MMMIIIIILLEGCEKEKGKRKEEKSERGARFWDASASTIPFIQVIWRFYG